MRLTLRAAGFVAVLALSSVAPAAYADPSQCLFPGNPQCPGFHCHTGDVVTIHVWGPDQVQGTVLCGEQRAHCSGYQFCSAGFVANANHAAGCDRTQGTSAICTAGVEGVSGDANPLDPIVCGVLKTAGVPGIVNALTSITGISMDADDCDLWMYASSSRIVDFAPYAD